ncbi:hypothetical protein ACFVR6_16065 [Microbacterium sp. NPDC058021]|uniref:hypothetical protein n=1 Tax=Microbacterium sp. NPDC058021 TaxID=3346306 RepID=UPI0036DEAA9E
MHGPQILSRFIQQQAIRDGYGNLWQYNSQSDRHSEAACWGVAFDLLRQSATLRRHANEGKVVIGVNHPMTDYRTGREKFLDLVIARPATSAGRSGDSFKHLARKYGLPLNAHETNELASLPDIEFGTVGSVHVALEAKAVMTKHVSSLPRLHDELAASEQAVHGASDSALAIAYVQINASDRFAPSPSNRFTIGPANPVVVRTNAQPNSVLRTLDKLAQLKRRSTVHESGFDGVGVTVLDFENLGGDVRVVTGSPAPAGGSSFDYETMIVRMAGQYDSRFAGV